ncbi:hypothetical protein D3C76_1845780 [compost metagenome]
MVSQVEQRPGTMLGNHFHGLAELESAIAALAAKNIAGMANAVHPDQGFFRFFKIAVD